MPDPQADNTLAILLASADRRLPRQVTRALTNERVPHRIYWVVEPALLVEQAQQLRPDVILVDTRATSEPAMPAAADLARAAPLAAVIVMADGDWALPAGASDSVRLPIDPADLAASVRGEVKRAAPVSAARAGPAPAPAPLARPASAEQAVYAVAKRAGELSQNAAAAMPARTGRRRARILIGALIVALLVAAGALIFEWVSSARPAAAPSATSAAEAVRPGAAGPGGAAASPRSLPGALLSGTGGAPAVAATPSAAIAAAPANAPAPVDSATAPPPPASTPVAVSTATPRAPTSTPGAAGPAVAAVSTATPRVATSTPGAAGPAAPARPTAQPPAGATGGRPTAAASPVVPPAPRVSPAGPTPTGLAPVLSLRLSPPAPVAPLAGATVHGATRFEWLATGPLPPGSGYELVWWNVDENPSGARGVAPPGQATALIVNLDVLYQSHELRNNSFYWTVLIVQLSPYARLTQPAGSVAQLVTYQP